MTDHPRQPRRDRSAPSLSPRAGASFKEETGVRAYYREETGVKGGKKKSRLRAYYRTIGVR